jgi:hypothetical protein
MQLTNRGKAALVLNQINLDRFIKNEEENEIVQASLATFVGFA